MARRPDPNAAVLFLGNARSLQLEVTSKARGTAGVHGSGRARASPPALR